VNHCRAVSQSFISRRRTFECCDDGFDLDEGSREVFDDLSSD